MSELRTIAVVARANLREGYEFLAAVDGRTFLVRVPRDVTEGDVFEVPHPDHHDEGANTAAGVVKKYHHEKELDSEEKMLCRVVCCCQAAPCCFPDGCCPDGCCPDGCCPNGNCGEQFEGCCFCYDFRDERGCGDDNMASSPAPAEGLRHLLKILIDSGANPKMVREGSKGAVQSVKKQQDAYHHENMADQSKRNQKKFAQDMKEVKALHDLVKEGGLSKEVADLKIRNILGISTDATIGQSVIYPLGGCCNYAPCLFPDGCCPDGCCPDGCCPNGCIGEQFKGCCMQIKGRPPWYAPAAITGGIHNDNTFVAMVDSIVNGDGTDEEVYDTLKGLLEATTKHKAHRSERDHSWDANHVNETSTLLSDEKPKKFLMNAFM